MKTHGDINTCHQIDNLRARRVNCSLWFSISKIMHLIIKMFYELSLIRSKTICIKFKRRKVKRQTMWQSREQWTGNSKVEVSALAHLALNRWLLLWEGGNVHNVKAEKETFKCSVFPSFLSKIKNWHFKSRSGVGWEPDKEQLGRKGLLLLTITGHIHHCGEATLQSQEQRETTAHMLRSLVLSLGNRATHGGLGHTLSHGPMLTGTLPK